MYWQTVISVNLQPALAVPACWTVESSLAVHKQSISDTVRFNARLSKKVEHGANDRSRGWRRSSQRGETHILLKKSAGGANLSSIWSRLNVEEIWHWKWNLTRLITTFLCWSPQSHRAHRHRCPNTTFIDLSNTYTFYQSVLEAEVYARRSYKLLERQHLRQLRLLSRAVLWLTSCLWNYSRGGSAWLCVH